MMALEEVVVVAVAKVGVGVGMIKTVDTPAMEVRVVVEVGEAGSNMV